MKTPGRLSDLVAIVTGGGSGFGEAMCHAFAREGACLAVADLNLEAANRVATALTSAGRTAIPIRADVAKNADMAALIAATVARFGRIDIMVNNAGISHANQPMLNVTRIFSTAFTP